MKICAKCKQKKPLSDFHNNTKSNDGKASYCKICANKCSKEWRDKNPDYYMPKLLERRKNAGFYRKLERVKEERNRDVINANMALWRKNNPEKWRRITNRTLKKNALKIKCRKILQYAVKKGEIVKPSKCSKCKAETNRIHAHHKNYRKPLLVEWLCKKCHSKEHWKYA